MEPRLVSRREGEVLAALGDRLTNAEVAERLHLSERTVESHVSSLLRKLGVSNRLELAALAKQVPSASLPTALAVLADPEGYVGRVSERARLTAAWNRASGGQSVALLVTAEAGMGKSRLVAELAALAHREGAQVLLGTCHDGVGRPYEPFAQLLQHEVDTVPSSEVQRRRGPGGAVLARLVPALASSEPDAFLDAATARAAVPAALLGYLTRTATRPTLVIVEDVHWATSTTLDVLRHVAAVSGPAPLMVVMTARDVAPERDEQLELFFADVARLPALEQVALVGLGPDEVSQLIERLGSGADPEEVIAQTAGNPLLVREVAVGQDRERGSTLPGLLLRRYALLGADDLAVLDVAAVLGSSFVADELAAAVGKPVLEVLQALERAAAAGLLVEDPERALGWSFWHALFRTARYESIPSARRTALHAAVADALSDSDRSRLPELARHAYLAAPIGDPLRAIELSQQAAVEAEAAMAFAEAAAHIRRALEMTSLLRPADEPLRLNLMTRLGEALQGAGDPSFRAVLLEAAGLARAVGDAQGLAEVAWAMLRYGTPGRRGRLHPDLASITEDALSALGPEPTIARARTLAAAADELCFFDPGRAVALAEEARLLARALGDPVTLGHVLLAYRLAGRTPDNLESRGPTADELVEIGARTRQPTFTILGLSTRAWSHREAGRLVQADAAMDEAIALRGDRTIPPTYLAAVTMYLSSQALLRGDLATAETIAGSVFLTHEQGYDPANWFGPALVMIRHYQGRLPELLSLLQGASLQAGIDVVYRTAMSVALAQDGQLEQARAIIRELVVDDLRLVPWNFTWLACLAALADAIEVTGEAEAARTLIHALTPYAGRVADLPQSVVAPVDLALAQLCLAAGDLDAAASWASRAITASRQRGTPVYLARELLRLAVARPDEAPALVAEALAIADETGALLVRQEAVRLGLTAP